MKQQFNKDEIREMIDNKNTKGLVAKYNTPAWFIYNIKSQFKACINGKKWYKKSNYAGILEELAFKKSVSGNGSKPDIKSDPFDKIDNLVTQFKNGLVGIVEELVNDISKEKIEKAFRDGKAVGTQEEQAKFLDAAKRDNIGSMLKRRLLGN
jgi:hypothetical protein